MKTMIAYSNRSCVTGKELREALEAIRKSTNRKAKCDLFLRWGNTQEFDRTRFRKELNKLEAVLRTTNKLTMLQTLLTAGVSLIAFSNDVALIEEFKDREGNLYIRNKLGVVRYGNDYDATRDLYFSRPVRFKRREYRVHVFNGKVIGAYEKVPLVPGSENRPKLFKSDTCKFVRVNVGGENTRLVEADYNTCIQAVNALGLDFGGVDLVRDKNGQTFVLEVNSAPGLNTHMREKYIAAINEYYNVG